MGIARAGLQTAPAGAWTCGAPGAPGVGETLNYANADDKIDPLVFGMRMSRLSPRKDNRDVFSVNALSGEQPR